MFWLCCFVFCLLVSCFCLSIFCVSSTSISNSAGNDLETLDKHLFLQHKNEILSKQKWTSKHRFSRVLGGRPGGRRLSTGGREANGERTWGGRVHKSKQKSGRRCNDVRPGPLIPLPHQYVFTQLKKRAHEKSVKQIQNPMTKHQSAGSRQAVLIR